MMTTTELTLDDLDAQLGRLDAARVGLTAQREQIIAELSDLRGRWRERATLGDVDAELTTTIKGYEASLTSVDEAIELNVAKHAEVAAQRGELVAAQQLAADREQYMADAAAFEQRADAASIIDRLLEVSYAALRATNVELDALNREQLRLDAEALRFGAPRPARKVDVAWTGAGQLERTPTELLRAVLNLSGWMRDQRSAVVLAEYLRVRLLVATRETPNEPAPTWPQVVERL